MNLHGHLPLPSAAPWAMEMPWLLSTSGFLHPSPESPGWTLTAVQPVKPTPGRSLTTPCQGRAPTLWKIGEKLTPARVSSEDKGWLSPETDFFIHQWISTATHGLLHGKSYHLSQQRWSAPSSHKNQLVSKNATIQWGENSGPFPASTCPHLSAGNRQGWQIVFYHDERAMGALRLLPAISSPEEGRP